MVDFAKIVKDAAALMQQVALESQGLPAPKEVKILECWMCQGFGRAEDGERCFNCAGKGRVATDPDYEV